MQPYFQVAPDVYITVNMARETLPILEADNSKQGTKMWLLHVGNLVADEGIFLPLVRALVGVCDIRSGSLHACRLIRPPPATPTQSTSGATWS